MIIVNVLFATPFAVWMLKAFFKLIPNEIEEAAYIDGASRYIVISRIIVPLAAPGIASVSIFCFIISWTEYLFASILISGDDLKTLPVGLAGIVGQYQIDWGFLLSGAVLASLPVIALFVFIGKYFIEGHVPLEAVNKLLKEQPDIDGIALPGMPIGTPGMPGKKEEPFVVYQLIDGKFSIFMTI